jgi:transposase
MIMPRQPAPPAVVSEDDRRKLTRLINSPTTSQGEVLRARALVEASSGATNVAIASKLGITRSTLIEWRRRYAAGGLPAVFSVRAGRGRKATHGPEKVQQIVNATLHTKPEAETHWSCRTMAKAQGVSPATVQRIWDAHNLQPHRVETFKLSTDKRFVEKLTDVVGLYLAPPDNAIVLCVDEKSQVQALDRTQPGLPLKKGRCGTMTHDYKRNGTTTLFAAINVLTGTVIGECLPRHRHQEFLKFLRRIDREFASTKQDLHLIVDNYGTHTHPVVKQWLERHPRYHLHFTPTSSSWLNLIERWFREITDKAIRRGAFSSVPDLIDKINAYINKHNADAKPFIWTASVESIMEKITKCRAIYETLH